MKKIINLIVLIKKQDIIQQNDKSINSQQIRIKQRCKNEQKAKKQIEYNYFNRQILMSSFLFEKQQINCACFESNSQNDRRIFRSYSHHNSSNETKKNNQILNKEPSQHSKNKKKSLKRDKCSQGSVSENNQQRQQMIQDLGIPNIQMRNNKKEVKHVNFQYSNVQKNPVLRTQRHRPIQNIRINQYIQPISQNYIMYIPQKNNQYTHSEQLIQTNYNQQYEKLIQQEFKKDFNNYKYQMETKKNKQMLNRNNVQKKEKNQENIARQRRNSQMLTASIQRDVNRVNKTDKQVKQLSKQQTLTDKEIQQLEKFISKTHIKPQTSHVKANSQININTHAIKHSSKNTPKRRDSLTNKKVNLDKIQFSSQIHTHHKQFSQLKQPSFCRQRKQSFRNSTILYKQKQRQQKAKKLRDTIYAKEIQSEKDSESQTDSDKISQVVGRGWDGLTEQKIQLQELDQMIKNQLGHSQTMVTQQSHIKNSQTKTFTEYSNSFISPKSQKTKQMVTSTAFGNPNYGVGGLSFKNFQDLRKVRNSSYGQNQF